MFSGLHGWPALGNDIESDGLGVCAGTSFNTPAAANRIGLRVAYVATVGTDVWSRMIRDEFDVEGIPTDFLEIEDRPLPGVSVALNLDGDRGFVTYWGSDDGYDARLASRAELIATTVEARHLHAYVDETPDLVAIARRRGMSVSLDAWGGLGWSSSRSLAEVLADADVLLANEIEATAMSGEANAERALDRLADYCDCVVIKRGPAGALGLAGGQVELCLRIPSRSSTPPARADCFNAGFLAGWLGGLALEESLTLGVICGSRAVGDYGGYRGCPREPELRRIAASRGIAFPRREATREESTT